MANTSVSVDGVSRNMKAWRAVSDGAAHDMTSVNALVNGVKSPIFSSVTKWEKYAVRHYFETEDVITFFNRESCVIYESDYLESGYSPSDIPSVPAGSYFSPVDFITGEKSDNIYKMSSPGRHESKAYRVISFRAEKHDTVIEIVESDDPNAYPENGEHTDGYWYIKI